MKSLLLTTESIICDCIHIYMLHVTTKLKNCKIAKKIILVEIFFVFDPRQMVLSA